MDEWMTVEEMARRLGITEDRAWYLFDNRVLRCEDRPDRRTYVRAKDVAEVAQSWSDGDDPEVDGQVAELLSKLKPQPRPPREPRESGETREAEMAGDWAMSELPR